MTRRRDPAEADAKLEEPAAERTRGREPQTAAVLGESFDGCYHRREFSHGERFDPLLDFRLDLHQPHDINNDIKRLARPVKVIYATDRDDPNHATTRVRREPRTGQPHYPPSNAQGLSFPKSRETSSGVYSSKREEEHRRSLLLLPEWPLWPEARCFSLVFAHGLRPSGRGAASSAVKLEVATLGVRSPAGGDDAAAFFGVGYGEGADGGAVPEDLLLGFVVVDGVGGGVDVDAGKVVAVDLVQHPGD